MRKTKQEKSDLALTQEPSAVIATKPDVDLAALCKDWLLAKLMPGPYRLSYLPSEWWHYVIDMIDPDYGANDAVLMFVATQKGIGLVAWPDEDGTWMLG